MARVPSACPHCGHPELDVQVVAWATYRDGRFHLIDSSEAEIEDVRGTPLAHCRGCDHEWELEE